MAKIAVELERALARQSMNGAAGQTTARRRAQGDGWTVEHVVCASGPKHRPFEEHHSGFSIAIVAVGTFQYRSANGRELMTPLLPGNPGQCFECGHNHSFGDCSLLFYYEPHYFERLSAHAGLRGPTPDFRALRLPSLVALSPFIARACAGLTQSTDRSVGLPLEELSVQLAVETVQSASGISPHPNGTPPSAETGVTRVVRSIERHPDASLRLASLAREARLSPFHFLRIFERMTGLTPHQYILRARLREAAIRLADKEPTMKVIDIALDCGFGDVSNFNRAFRVEFDASPRAYRLRVCG